MSEEMPSHWTNARRSTAGVVPMPGWVTSFKRGLAMRCPSCGKSPAFSGYLTVRAACPSCNAPLGRAPCDDAPPYLTLLVTLHIIAVIMILADRGGHLDYRTSLFIFVPMTILLELGLLRPIKGATLAVMLKVNFLRREPNVTAGSGDSV